MTRREPSLIEVTGAVVHRARVAKFAFGEDTALVAVQHLLCQTVDLFRAVAKLGLEPQHIFVLGKVYSNCGAVMQTLRRMGVIVVEGAIPKPGEFEESFEEDVKRLWDFVGQRMAERQIRRIIVLDDGGECINNIPDDLLRQYIVGAVEQTSRGMFVLQEKPPPFAVISWARSAVKLQMGGPIFSRCLIDKLNTNFLGGRPLRGAEVGILGMGSIGRGLANLIHRGNDVLFYDPDLHFQPQYLHGNITRLNSLEELMLRCDYVFGCSGRNPFRDKWPTAHRPGIKLFSVSSGDQEFGPIIQHLKHDPSFNVVADNWNITSDDGPCGPILIAYLGYPYTFVSRGPTAVPTRIVQLETGGLLASLIQARNHLRLFEEGSEQNAGIHRLAPAAQSFVFEKWLGTMAERRIDVRELYDYDPAMLEAAKGTSWLVDNSEPNPRTGYKPISRVEESMNSIVIPGHKLTLAVGGQT